MPQTLLLMVIHLVWSPVAVVLWIIDPLMNLQTDRDWRVDWI